MTDSNRSRSAGSAGRAKNDARGPATLAQRACIELAELLGREPEGIVSLERADDGWRVGVEVTELRRIPDTADIIAIYEVDTDQDGALLSYRRVRRYVRGAVEDEQ